MSLWDDICDVTKKVASTVADTAVAAGEKVGELASDGFDAVVSGAKTTWDVASSGAQASWDAVSSGAQSAWDSVADFTSLKIKGALKSLDLQSTIDSLNQYQKEKGTDVSVLTNFITRLKEFSEDGK